MTNLLYCNKLENEAQAIKNMSSFKSYGKVDEQEQMVLDARRKTRKRITIISLSSIILAGVVFAAVFGIVNVSSDKSQDGNAHSVPNAVKAVCDVTLYKDSCYSSLGSLVHSGQFQPEELFKLSIKVALTEVSKAVKYFSEDGVFDGLKLKDSRTKEALKNCRDLLDLAVDHLNYSLSYGGNSSVLDVFEDLQTWLSAAGTITSIHAIIKTYRQLSNLFFFCHALNLFYVFMVLNCVCIRSCGYVAFIVLQINA